LQATLSADSGDVSSAGGTVTFYDSGSQIGSVQVTSGGASFALSLPQGGGHNYTATYSGDDQFASASTTAAVSLTVTPLQLTASVTGASVVYGQAVPAISGTLAGVLPQDSGLVTAVFATAATSTSTVGSYPITVSLTGPAAGNYTAQLTPAAVVTITPAPLTVTANNATRLYGAANPVFSGSFAGAVNNDQFTATYTTAATSTSPVGGYPITPVTVNGAHAASYTVSMVNGTLSVTQAGSAVSLSSSGSSGAGANLTVTANVVSLTTGVPTGTVDFYEGGTLLGTGIVNLQGVATYSTTTLSPGTHLLTGIYSGDTNFTTSTSSQLSVTVAVGDYTMTAPGYLTILRGQAATAQITIAPNGGYQGGITFSCTGLPSFSSCAVNPATLTADGTNTSLQATLTISTTGSSHAQLLPLPGRTDSLPATLYFLPSAFAGVLLIPAGRKRRSGKKLLRFMVLSLLLLLAALGMTACGGSGRQPDSTQIGAYTVTLTATGDHGVIHSSSVVLMVQ
jgi:hypothetical protein